MEETVETLSKSDAVSPQVFDGQTGLAVATPVSRRRRKLDLESVRGVRAELVMNYRLVRRGKMDSAEANRRAWNLRQIAELIVIEEDIERIHEQLAQIQAANPALLGGMTSLPEA